MSPVSEPTGSFVTHTAEGEIFLQTLTATDDLLRFTPGEGLGSYCRYRAGETLAMLHRVLRAPQGRVLAAIRGDTLVGYLVFFQPGPEERWGQRSTPGLLELGALEVDRAWRRRGVARLLLSSAFTGGSLDEAIVIAPQFATDWDLESVGLNWREYRQLVLRLFRR
ncbi:MAG TPA: GNAT family N-acetyltransferase, partial [Candidatus Acidoferrum sp.]|nr:GNAT family N-acetyltransferase [Candidatus Acidoferrum sp.]